MRWFLSTYKIVALGALTLYLYAGLTGYRVSDGERERVDPSVRSSPGGYRSFHFWHTGFAGGK